MYENLVCISLCIIALIYVIYSCVLFLRYVSLLRPKTIFLKMAKSHNILKVIA